VVGLLLLYEFEGKTGRDTEIGAGKILKYCLIDSYDLPLKVEDRAAAPAGGREVIVG